MDWRDAEAWTMTAICNHCKEVLWEGQELADDGLERGISDHDCEQQRDLGEGGPLE